MNDRKVFPWVNLWMLVFSVGGIWLIGGELLNTDFVNPGGSIGYWLALGVLVGIALAALWRLPMPFSEESEGPEPTLPTLGRLYLHSWRMLLRMRWLLIIVGGIALITLAEGLTDHVIFGHRLAKEVLRTEGLLHAATGPVSPMEYVVGPLPSDLARKTFQASGSFLPHLTTHAATGGLIAPLAVLALMVWLNRRLKRLAGDPRLGRTALLCRIMFIPTAAVALTVPPATYLARMAMLAYAADPTVHNPAFPVTPVYCAWGILFSLFITPFLLAGFTGSLKRSSEGEQVSADTFVKDVARYLKPFVCFFLALSVIETIISLPVMMMRPGTLPAWFLFYNNISGLVVSLLLMLLMFVPYAIVAREAGTFRALKIGIRDWLSHAGTVVSFVAVGIAIIVPIQVFQDAVRTMARGLSEWGFAINMLYVPIETMLAAWLAVSVWELYRRVGSRTPEPEVVEE